VGVGTTAPSNTLHVKTGTSGAEFGSLLFPLAVESFQSAYINVLTPDASERGIFFGDPSNIFDGGIVYNGGGSSNGLEFRVNGNSTQMVIDSSGRVGLGGAFPSHPLEVGTDSSTGNGAHVTAGGTWTNGSSRSFKHGFEPVDTQAMLQKVVGLPLARWQYNGEAAHVQHIGPVAEDFHAAFGLGHDERYITTIDADGVALAAIQGLHVNVQEKDCKMESMESEIQRLNNEISELKSIVKTMTIRNEEGGR